MVRLKSFSSKQMQHSIGKCLHRLLRHLSMLPSCLQIGTFANIKTVSQSPWNVKYCLCFNTLNICDQLRHRNISDYYYLLLKPCVLEINIQKYSMRQTHTQTRMKTINWKLEHMHNFLDHTTFSLMGNYFVLCCQCRFQNYASLHFLFPIQICRNENRIKTKIKWTCFLQYCLNRTLNRNHRQFHITLNVKLQFCFKKK